MKKRPELNELISKHELWTLHRYFLWSDTLRERYFEVLQKKFLIKNKEPIYKDIYGFMYMSYWYASMYVVIEGWKRLKLSDLTVDELLKSKNVGFLKTYRHAVFHFQNIYIDKKFIPFIKENGTPDWIFALRQAFSEYFLKSL